MRLIDQVRELVRLADMESDYMFKTDDASDRALEARAWGNIESANILEQKANLCHETRLAILDELKMKLKSLRK